MSRRKNHYSRVRGETIKVLLALQGLTQVDLAIKAGYNPGFVCDIISGKKNPSFDTLDAIATVLQVDMYVLLTDVDKADLVQRIRECAVDKSIQTHKPPKEDAAHA